MGLTPAWDLKAPKENRADEGVLLPAPGRARRFSGVLVFFRAMTFIAQILTRRAILKSDFGGSLYTRRNSVVIIRHFQENQETIK